MSSDNNKEETFEHADLVHSTTSEPSAPPVPSAPPSSDDNGYIVVSQSPQPSSQSSIDHAVDSVLDSITHKAKESQDDINNLLGDLSSKTEDALNKVSSSAGNAVNTVLAEADSSTQSVLKPLLKTSEEAAAKISSPTKKECSSSGCSLCPYYLMGCDYLSKVNIPPQVKDLILWTNPKLTGAVFGTLFVLLLSLACFSLLTVIGTLFLLALSVVGLYRFYLALVFRIKGTYDDTFDKLSNCNLSVSKEKFQELSRLIENDSNKCLNNLKSIILWDNITKSIIAFVGFYFLYCIGSVFNTLTLLIIALVDVFTLPKIYQVYKKPIDNVIEKGTTCAHGVVKQIMTKLPFLNKKKTQ